MKRFFTLFLVVLIALSFAGCNKKSASVDSSLNNDWDTIVERGTVKIGVFTGAFLTVNADGTYSGFTHDMIEAISKSLGISFELVTIANETDGEELLDSKQIDCLWGIVSTPALTEGQCCSSPFLYSDFVAVLKSENAVQYPTVLSMKGLPNVAAVTDSLGEQTAKNAGLTVLGTDNVTEALAAVASDSIKAAILDYAEILPYLDNPNYTSFGVGARFDSYGYAILYRDRSSLNPRIRNTIKKLTENGSLDALADTYGYSGMLASNREIN